MNETEFNEYQRGFGELVMFNLETMASASDFPNTTVGLRRDDYGDWHKPYATLIHPAKRDEQIEVTVTHNGDWTPIIHVHCGAHLPFLIMGQGNIDADLNAVKERLERFFAEIQQKIQIHSAL